LPLDGKIRCVLISVTDKTGILEFARALAESGVELISTGGTARLMRDAGIAVREMAESGTTVESVWICEKYVMG